MFNYGIIDCLTATQEELLTLINKNKYTFNRQGNIIYSPKGADKALPMLCVHLDTINTHRSSVKPTREHFDFVNTTHSYHLSSKGREELTCLGGDDRAGLWIALRLIDYMEATNNYFYRIGFFIDEEIGCIGSGSFVDEFNTTAYIGLDRRSYKGRNEIALYGYDNDELTKIFTDLGYKEVSGSVTDASTLAERSSNIACINLSVGYDNEHTKDEILYCEAMFDTLRVLKKLPSLDTKFKVKPYVTDSYEFDTDDYLLDLEERLSILEETITAMGMDIDDVLEQGGYYAV